MLVYLLVRWLNRRPSDDLYLITNSRRLEREREAIRTGNGEGSVLLKCCGVNYFSPCLWYLADGWMVSEVRRSAALLLLEGRWLAKLLKVVLVTSNRWNYPSIPVQSSQAQAATKLSINLTSHSSTISYLKSTTLPFVQKALFTIHSMESHLCATCSAINPQQPFREPSSLFNTHFISSFRFFGSYRNICGRGTMRHVLHTFTSNM